MAAPSRVLRCHEGDCVSCSLCKKGNSKFIHPCHIKLKALPSYKWIKENCPNLHDEACICQPCFKQIKRNLGNPGFTPRWSPKPPKPTKACCVDQCKHPVYSTTNLVTAEQLQTLFDCNRITSFSISASISQTSLALCKDHYLGMYQQLHAPSPCCSCGAKPKKGTTFNRHCSNPQAITEYLSHVSDDPLNLTESSTICYTCYLHFNRVLNQLQQTNTDQDLVPLDIIVKQMSLQKAAIEGKGESITKDEYTDLVLCVTGLKLAESMKIDEVVLLPDLYDFFCAEMSSRAVFFPLVGQFPASDIPRTRWVLSHLSHHFGDVLKVECKHRRFGSLLYHANCDLLKAVSLALGRNRMHKATSFEPPESPPQTCSTIDEQISSVASYLNERVHMQAKTFVANFHDAPDKYASFSIDWLYEAIDPSLMSFIQQLTQSVRSRRRKLFINDTEILATKRIRHAYLLCTVLFCSNTQCSMPFHNLLTEAVLCHGGSQELVRILNRVGAVASLETNRRLATLVVEQRMSKGIVTEIHPKSLSVVSIDNIDILQSHAFVSSTDKTRSWHGTSVQCTQPLPLSAHLSNDEMIVPPPGRKHGPSLSPPASPIPVEKSKRRRRTLTEQLSPHTRLANNIEPLVDPHFDVTDYVEYDTQAPSCYSMSEFKFNQTESEAMVKLQGDIFNCMILKYVHLNSSDCKLPGLQSLINCVANQTSSCEVSNVVYVEILSELADTKPTLISILGRLHKTFIQELRHRWLLVVGDAKVFVILQEIKSQYGSHLSWMLPFPGDWHILYNYQPALMKPYADAGLAKLAESSGHRSETLSSLLQCKNFRRTHNFFMQAFEAFYTFFLSLYFKTTPHEALHREVSDLITDFSEITTDSNLESFRQRVQTVVSRNVSYQGFKEFMEAMANKQDTIRFWYRFITEDCFAYFALFVGIRYRNWDLRMASLKQQAAIFSAFDRSTYQRLVPTHIGDVLRMPEAVLQHLRKGSFSVRFTNTEWHGVALDECHEMKINKDAKLAIVRPSRERMEFLSNYMAFQAKCVRNLSDQIFPEHCETTAFTHRPTSKDRKAHINMQRMHTVISSHGMFFDRPENQGLWNVLVAKQASEEQQHDLMSFRSIGEKGFEHFIQQKYIRTASTNAPVRQKRLCTFSVTQTQKRRIQQVEKEQKQYQRYLKRTLAWVAEHGAESIDAEALFRPIQSVPRALIDANGFPYKSTKSSTTTFFQHRYKNPQPITNKLPYGWTPDTVIMEGMFLIQTAPLPTMSCMRDYTLLLLNRFVRPHFAAGTMSVHVVFDTPGSLPETPKELEQRNRGVETKVQTPTTIVALNLVVILSCLANGVA